VSAHPFTTTLGSDDVRITTRFQEDFFGTGLFGIIHECGHALYEQGVAEEIRGTATGDGTSLGIHESQSRFWENVIGRSPEFWQRYYPDLKKIFPQQLDDISADEFFRAINIVEPSLIRVEADEVTYGLHIILRFRLEQELMNNGLKVPDLPEAWNAGMQELLGIRPDKDANGVLQDIHWSAGLIGYFPTYALGNLYSGMFTRAMEADLPEMRQHVASGDFAPILGWLRERIHRHGAAKSAEELATDITGGTLDAQPFVDYLEAKYAQVYRL
jgi:carboxypeptidase Taq